MPAQPGLHGPHPCAESARPRRHPVRRSRTPADETADNIQDANNTDTPWVDQSQTYTSHSSHQVFLRQYVNNSANKPVSTGKLLDGIVTDDPLTPGCSTAAVPCYNDGNATTGSISTWAATKKQAAELLGLRLEDKDVTNIPMIAADPYGKFIPGPARGLPAVRDRPPASSRATPAAPVPVPANALHFDTPFLTDIAHNADPSPQEQRRRQPDVTPARRGPDDARPTSRSSPPAPMTTSCSTITSPAATVAATRTSRSATIHQVFHHEHDRLVDYIKNVLLSDTSATGIAALPQWQLAEPDAAGWNGERLFQAARFVTEMEYQHLVFEEFARKIQPADPALPPVPHRHQRGDPRRVRARRVPLRSLDARRRCRTHERRRIGQLPAAADGVPQSAGVLQRRLQPVSSPPRQAAGSIVMGSSDQVGNELDEFVVETLRNNLLGLPLDLPTLNMTRARDAGVPPLNDVRRQIYALTNDGADDALHELGGLRPEPQAPRIADQLRGGVRHAPDASPARPRSPAKRAAAKAIVDPQGAPATDPSLVPADAADFMFGTGAWANDAERRDHHRPRQRRPLGRRSRRDHQPVRRPAGQHVQLRLPVARWRTSRTATACTTSPAPRA